MLHLLLSVSYGFGCCFAGLGQTGEDRQTNLNIYQRKHRTVWKLRCAFSECPFQLTLRNAQKAFLIQEFWMMVWALHSWHASFINSQHQREKANYGKSFHTYSVDIISEDS